MAVSETYTWNIGTTTTTTTWTTAGTSNTDGTYDYIQIYNPKPQIKVKDPYAGKKKKTMGEIFKKPGFWDGVEWEEYTSYIPRKSITGKIIIGKMHKRWRTPEPAFRGKGLGVFKQFAKKKELFEGKLKGKA